MHPALNLLLAAAIALLAYLLFRVRRGWFWRWLRRGVDPERVRMEDSLKHLYHCQEVGQPASLDSLAGALEVPRNVAVRLATGLERHKLAEIVGGQLKLTESGQRYALQIIRTHRLWEQYLAERTGVDEAEWHEQAEHREHQMTPAEANALAARMGDPRYDPHGDPIPTADGVLPEPRGVSLDGVGSGSIVRITHVEDEPEDVYRVLRSAGLRLGIVLEVGDWEDQRLTLHLHPGTCALTALEAANVTVEPSGKLPSDQLPVRPMSSLAIGQRGRVENISPGCLGIERRRLLDLGLVPGTVVSAEMPQPGRRPDSLPHSGRADCAPPHASCHDPCLRRRDREEITSPT